MVSPLTCIDLRSLRVGTSAVHRKRHRCSSTMAAALSVRVAVVGDVHDDWDLEEDVKALQFLKPDLVLFTGDFGNENVALVRSIAKLDMPKAVILGNHDAWGTPKFSSREKDPVQLQLECLGDAHVGYRRMDFSSLKLSIVGGRPFSCGGDNLFRKKLLSARYGVHNMEGSANKIFNAASGTPKDHSAVFLAHNGPTCLGSNINDICGRDWVYEGGDHGDPDLTRAISQLKETTQLSVPLVVFGHMHKQLARGKGLRKMIVVGEDDTVYLNGAIVPRIQRLGHEQATEYHSRTPGEGPVTMSPVEGTLRAFTIAEFLNKRLEKVSEVWVSVIGEETNLVDEKIMFSRKSTSYQQTI